METGAEDKDKAWALPPNLSTVSISTKDIPYRIPELLASGQEDVKNIGWMLLMTTINDRYTRFKLEGELKQVGWHYTTHAIHDKEILRP